MAETIKFTEEEVQAIQALRQNVTNVFTQLGQVRIERKRRLEEIEKLESELHDRHTALQDEEQKLFAQLNEKYGDGNYNPETNEFIPTEENQEVSTEEN